MYLLYVLHVRGMIQKSVARYTSRHFLEFTLGLYFYVIIFNNIYKNKTVPSHLVDFVGRIK